MPSEELKKLAEELKESREKAEVTLQHIAAKTRIDLKFLQAIEDGDFEVLPEVYIRAFIREYAGFCGLDPAKTIEKYELAKKGKTVKFVDNEVSKEEKNSEQKNIKREFDDEPAENGDFSASKINKQKIILFGGIAILFLLVIMAYFLFIKNSSPDIVVEKPFEEVLKEQNKRFEITEEDKPQKPAAVMDSIALSIIATDTCWVNVTVDEKVDKEFMLYKNNSLVLKAAVKFDVIVGNAGGISMKLNGQPLNITGSKGQRKTFSVNKDGLINSSN
jgi:cytoskeletal protein RodZ